AEGDHVDADEPLLEVSTDKVDTEVPSPVSGTLLSIMVQEDETVEIGVELAVIGEAGESAAAPAASSAEPEPAPPAAAPESVAASASPTSSRLPPTDRLPRRPLSHLPPQQRQLLHLRRRLHLLPPLHRQRRTLPLRRLRLVSAAQCSPCRACGR